MPNAISSAGFSNFTQVQRQQTRVFEQAASGRRINGAADDAAGLSISTRLDAQDSGIRAALSNSQSAISRLQVEDGALANITEHLQRIRELTVQQGNGILSEQDKQGLQGEIEQGLQQIDQISQQAQFNGQGIFTEQALTVQVEPNAAQQFTLPGLDLSTQLSQSGVASEANPSLDQLDQAITQVAQRRSEVGAAQNTLVSTSEFLQLKNINNQQSTSRIRDADFAALSAQKSQNDVQQQVQISVQAQANISRAQVLQLLKSE